jgi:ribosomal protein S18 acetylase RimI-like enzyme
MPVRPGTDADRAFMVEAFRWAALASYPELEQLGRLTLADRLEELWAGYDQPDRRWWIATDGDRSVGGCWVNPGYHPVLDHPEGVILAIAVHPDFRGRGHARALLETARAVLASEGIVHLRLFVHPDNLPARRLYEALGYRVSTLEMRRD